MQMILAALLRLRNSAWRTSIKEMITEILNAKKLIKRW